jgi:hypothetical protein
MSFAKRLNANLIELESSMKARELLITQIRAIIPNILTGNEPIAIGASGLAWCVCS